MNDTHDKTQLLQVECTATKDMAVRMFIVAAMCIGWSVWCYFDKENFPPPEAWDMEHFNKAAGYVVNHFSPHVFIPLALILIAFGIRSARRRLIADEEGIGYVGKAKVPWSEITALDASVLKSKQILTLHHSRDKKLKLDGYNLKNFRDLVAFVEQRVPEAVKREAGAAPKQDQ